jgi:hypothetical protein
MLDHDLTIRPDTPGDADALARLAWLDARPSPAGRALLAERDGVAIAAVALTSGAIVGGLAVPPASPSPAPRRAASQPPAWSVPATTPR